MTANTDTPPTVTVQDLMAIFAECDPAARVTLHLPMWFADGDKAIAEDADAFAGELGYTPQVVVGFEGLSVLDSDGRVRADAKPNVVSIQLSPKDLESLIAVRKEAINDA